MAVFQESEGGDQALQSLFGLQVFSLVSPHNLLFFSETINKKLFFFFRNKEEGLLYFVLVVLYTYGIQLGGPVIKYYKDKT